MKSPPLGANVLCNCKLLFIDFWHYPSNSWPSCHISIFSSRSSYLWTFLLLTLSLAFKNLVHTTFLKITHETAMLLTALDSFWEEDWQSWAFCRLLYSLSIWLLPDMVSLVWHYFSEIFYTKHLGIIHDEKQSISEGRKSNLIGKVLTP